MARIVGVDIPDNKHVEISLTYIFGLGRTSARKILEKAEVPFNLKTKDLTEDQRYTISEASHRFAAALDDQLTIKAYFTEKDLSAQIVPLYEQVMDVLEEYETASNGKIKLERYDPSESTAPNSRSACAPPVFAESPLHPAARSPSALWAAAPRLLTK